MADEVPQSTEWYEIFDWLSPENYRRVMDKKVEMQRLAERSRWAALSEEQKRQEAEKWQRILVGDEPQFFGNMGQPETRSEYESRYARKSDKTKK
jgi:hypothetical protein